MPVFSVIQKGCLVLILTVFSVHTSAQSKTDADSAAKMSLIKVAPILYNTAARSWRFYGDENTRDGKLREGLLKHFPATRTVRYPDDIRPNSSSKNMLQSPDA